MIQLGIVDRGGDCREDPESLARSLVLQLHKDLEWSIFEQECILNSALGLCVCAYLIDLID
jgi:hypothetical protein